MPVYDMIQVSIFLLFSVMVLWLMYKFTSDSDKPEKKKETFAQLIGQILGWDKPLDKQPKNNDQDIYQRLYRGTYTDYEKVKIEFQSAQEELQRLRQVEINFDEMQQRLRRIDKREETMQQTIESLRTTNLTLITEVQRLRTTVASFKPCVLESRATVTIK